jgi:hypothetical protein
MISFDAPDSSWIAAESCSAALLICSAVDALTVPLRAASAVRASCSAAACPCSSDLRLLARRRPGLRRGARLLLRRTGDDRGPLPGFDGRAIGFERGGQGFLAAVGDLLHVLAQGIERRHHGGAVLGLGDRRVRRLLQRRGDVADVGLDLRRELLDVLRAFLRRLGKRPDLVGHDGEAAALFARARRLDRRVEGEQVGLVGDAAHRARDLADVLGAAFELAHHLHRGALAHAVALDGAHRGADLQRRLGQGQLQRFGAAARAVGLGRATPRLAVICLIACSCSCEAPAASVAPLAICSIARRSSSAAADASVRPLASSSVAAASRSATRLWVPARGFLEPLARGAAAAAGGGSTALGGRAAAAALPLSFDLLTRAMRDL